MLRAPLSKAWTGVAPLLVAAALYLGFGVWALFALVDPRGGWHVAAYLVVWVGAMVLALRLADGPASPGGALPFIVAVGVLALFEEAVAYGVGGGLGGAATSLADDWVRAVPSFVGMGAGALLAARWLGSSRTDAFLAGVVGGLLVEVVLARGASPVAWVLFGGSAGWTYGALAGFPWLPRRDDRGTEKAGAGAPAKGRARRLAGAVVLANVGLFGGLLVGLLVAQALRL